MISSWLSLGRRRRRQRAENSTRSLFVKLLLVLIFAAGAILIALSYRRIASSPKPLIHATWRPNTAEKNTTYKAKETPSSVSLPNNHHVSQEQENSTSDGPYHNRQHFMADYKDMMENLKIYVYPTAATDDDKSSSSYTSLFPNIFQPISNPNHPNLKMGNYYSEHAFKAALLKSPLLTLRPDEAYFFFMPFSINIMRYEPRLHSAASIKQFVANYTNRVASDYPFWNASGGSDHLYVCCHSIGRDAAFNHNSLHNNAIQVTCSSNYFQRLYVAHKDVPLAQVWPRPNQPVLNPPHARKRLVFFVGRKQNSLLRYRLISLLEKDTSMDIFSGNLSFSYEEGFRRSKYCLHVKGYEVNTARISDAIHYGCIPVIISDYYDLPFANILDWSKFSVIISEADIASLKDILLSVSEETYLSMYQNLCLVRRHFAWHVPPRRYDSFYMTAYQLWLRRGLHRLPK